MKKTKNFILFTAVAVLICGQEKMFAFDEKNHDFSAAEELQNRESRKALQIKVGEYCAFLNEVASSGDPFGLYDTVSMEEEIVSTKVGDHFEYQVAPRVDEEALMEGLTPKQEECFECWHEQRASPLMMFRGWEKPEKELNPSKDEKRRFGDAKSEGSTESEERARSNAPLAVKEKVPGDIQPTTSRLSPSNNLLNSVGQLSQLQISFKSSWLNSFFRSLHGVPRGRWREMKVVLSTLRSPLNVTLFPNLKGWTTFQKKNNGYNNQEKFYNSRVKIPLIGAGGLLGAGAWALTHEDNVNGNRYQSSLSSWMPHRWVTFCEEKANENKKSVPSWKEFIDKQNFKTERDQVVLWTGAQAGNLTRANNYATANGQGKKILERTQAGALLNGHNLWNPEWFKEYLKLPQDQNADSNNIFIQGLRAIGIINSFDAARERYAKLSKDEQEKAMAIWRYASQKLADGITGHVVAFILDQDHPKYTPGSIYHHVEKPTLLKNREVFLSEIIVKENNPLLTSRQQQSLGSNPQNKQILGYFETAKNAFNGLEPHFGSKPNRDLFLEQHDQLKKIDPTLFQELQQALQGKEFSLFTQKAEALAEVWDGLNLLLST